MGRLKKRGIICPLRTTREPGSGRAKSRQVNFDAAISSAENTLWFVDSRFANGTPDTIDLVIAQKQGGSFVRRPDSASLLQNVNISALNNAPRAAA